MKRRIVSALAGIALCLGAALAARADESFPSKSVTIMVGSRPAAAWTPWPA